MLAAMNLRLAWSYAGVALLGGALGCGSGKVHVDVPDGCNAVGGADCVLPFPSGYYEKDDPTSASGRRLDIPVGVLPADADGERIDPAKFNAYDGWSPNIALIMAWSTGFDPAPLPPVNDPAKSLDAASPTVIVDMETGEKVPHFAEKDAEAIDQGAQPPNVALIIRPVVRLKPTHRYAVGIKKTLKTPDGKELPVAAGFQALVDGKTTDDDRLEAARPRYADIFAKLAAADAPTDQLVVAWDFTTRSDEAAWRDMIDARDAMVAAAGANAANVTWQVDSTEDVNDATTLKIIHGTIDMPSVLSGDGGDQAVLERDASGKVIINAAAPTHKAPFVVVIPACASDPANLPLPMVEYGHGLIGSLDEATGGYPRSFAQRYCAAIIATEWRGMSEADLSAIGLALNNINKQDLVMEKLVQGVNQFVILEMLARGQFASDASFQLGGMPLLDATRVFYYGISQGGIFGGTFMAVDPFITRGVLGVPAADYNYIIERSSNWQTYRTFIYNSYSSSKLDAQIILGLLQMRWDLSDPISFIKYLTGDVEAPLPGVPAKQLLLQMARNDSQVANIGAELWARTAGIKVLGPALYTPFLLEVQNGPLSSALTQWDEHRLPIPTGENITAEDNHTHGNLRKRDKVNEQIIHFFDTGEIIDTCTMGGVQVACDCTTDEICGPDPSP
jgi:hypothetical protein